MPPCRSDRIERTRGRTALLLLPLLLISAGLACGGGEPKQTEAEILYNQGKYADALPLLRQEIDKQRTGMLLYRLGYSLQAVEGNSEARRRMWEEATPLLEKELNEPDGITLERFYYLAVIHLNEGDTDAMRRYARRAIDEVEKGPMQTSLDGEDWFRLARLHDFLQEPSEAESAYRRSSSVFRNTPAANPAYYGLALAQVADFDYENLRYLSATEGYEEAIRVLPETDQVSAFQHGLALIATDRFEEAAERLRADRNPETMSESQYAHDIAMLAHEIGSLAEDDYDGYEIAKMPMSSVASRMRQAGEALRAALEKHSYRRGDPLPAEVQQREKRFITLLRQCLVRQAKIQDFCLSEGLADLVRR